MSDPPSSGWHDFLYGFPFLFVMFGMMVPFCFWCRRYLETRHMYEELKEDGIDAFDPMKRKRKRKGN
ncbi:hypothetical protein NX059_004572 [Plenodomus lindquistii]|nr:hypothetical protein NX059_004572 [Plenodomus lindquistii]